MHSKTLALLRSELIVDHEGNKPGDVTKNDRPVAPR